MLNAVNYNLNLRHCKSLKLTVPMSKRDDLLRPEFWPTNVTGQKMTGQKTPLPSATQSGYVWIN